MKFPVVAVLRYLKVFDDDRSRHTRGLQWLHYRSDIVVIVASPSLVNSINKHGASLFSSRVILCRGGSTWWTGLPTGSSTVPCGPYPGKTDRGTGQTRAATPSNSQFVALNRCAWSDLSRRSLPRWSDWSVIPGSSKSSVNNRSLFNRTFLLRSLLCHVNFFRSVNIKL